MSNWFEQRIQDFEFGKRQHKWDMRFLGLCKFIAQWSKDPSTKVGAVIVDPETQRVISLGYNGFPKGVKDHSDRLNTRDIKYNLVLHAEVNALMFAQRPLNGFTLYVHPLAPCIRCAVQIVQAGIKRVVTVPPNESFARWESSIKETRHYLGEAGVTYLEIPLED